MPYYRSVLTWNSSTKMWTKSVDYCGSFYGAWFWEKLAPTLRPRILVDHHGMHYVIHRRWATPKAIGTIEACQMYLVLTGVIEP